MKAVKGEHTMRRLAGPREEERGGQCSQHMPPGTASARGLPGSGPDRGSAMMRLAGVLLHLEGASWLRGVQ